MINFIDSIELGQAEGLGMKVDFTDHSKDRYQERFDRMEAQDLRGESPNLPRIRREIARRGRAYFDPDTGTFYIVVNNLKVYVAKRDGNVLAIVTTYPYKKAIRHKLNKLDRMDIALS